MKTSGFHVLWALPALLNSPIRRPFKFRNSDCLNFLHAIGGGACNSSPHLMFHTRRIRVAGDIANATGMQARRAAVRSKHLFHSHQK